MTCTNCNGAGRIYASHADWFECEACGGTGKRRSDNTPTPDKSTSILPLHDVAKGPDAVGVLSDDHSP